MLQFATDVAGGALLINRSGERWLVPAPLDPNHSHEVPLTGTPARTILPFAPIGALRTPSGVMFVTESAATYTAIDALGPVNPLKTGLTHRGTSVSSTAIVSIDGNSIVRSTDGVAWAKATVPSFPGTLVKTTMTRKGRGLALVSPQRLLLTEDDGVTWRLVPPPSGAADDVRTNSEHVIAANGFVLESGDKWRYVPHPLPYYSARVGRTPTQADNTEAERVDWGWGALAGESVYMIAAVDETAETPPFRLRLEKRRLGDTALPAVVAELSCDDASISAVGTAVAYSCVTGDGAQIRRSDDSGKTWRDDAKVTFGTAADPIPEGPPRSNAPIIDRRLHIGAGGALLLAGACPSNGTCTTPGVVRIAGGSAFEAVKVDAPHARFGVVRFAGKHAYAVGTVGGSERGGAIFSSNDGGRSFSHVKVDLGPRPKYASDLFLPDRGSLVIDDSDALVRAVVVEGEYRCGVFEKVAGAWTALKAPGVPSFAGLHGLAAGAETHDGGHSWRPVTGAIGRVQCSEFGCLVGSHDRRGWDFPKPPPPPVLTGHTPIRCSRTGQVTSLGSRPYFDATAVDLAGDTRFVVVSTSPTGAANAVVARAAGVSTIKLLGSDPVKREFLWRASAGGVAVGQYVYRQLPHDEKAMDFAAWLRADDGKVITTTLRPLGLSSRPGAVQHGGVFYGNTFIDDAGAVTLGKFPDNTYLPSSELFVVGGRTHAVDVRPFEGIVASSSLRPSGDWAPSVSWSTSSRTMLRTMHAGAPAVAAPLDSRAGGASGGWLIALDGAADPRPLVALPTQATLGDPPTVCTAESSTWAHVLVPPRHGTLHPVTIGTSELDATDYAIVRLAPDGRACVKAYAPGPTNEGDTTTGIVLFPEDLAHGWALTRDATGYSLQSLSCQYAPGPVPSVFAADGRFFASP